MEKLNQELTFNGQENFNRELISIFTQIINDKLPMFLEYCIQTNRAEPIKDVLYTLSVNVF